MNTTVVAAVAAMGGLMIVLGIALVVVKRKPAAPEIPEETAEGDVADVVRDAVMLAIELCRADGSLSPSEMHAISSYVAAQFTRYEGDAERLVDRTLKATIVGSAAKEAVTRLSERAGVEDRKKVAGLLVAVLDADGERDPAEIAFLQQVARRLQLGSDVFEALGLALEV